MSDQSAPTDWTHPDRDLLGVLERSKQLGFLGPGPVEDHVEHAQAFARALPSPTCRFADLGAGGGVPALPTLRFGSALGAVLIDASRKRCSFLQWAVVELGMADRVEVWCERAEIVGHEQRARQRFDAVLARGFGPPAATIECAAPLVVTGGLVVISEPPIPRRWPSAELGAAGLTQRSDVGSGGGVAVFERTGPVPEALPRPAKRQQRDPLFEVT